MRLQVRELLAPLVTDNDANIEVAGYAALSLGLVFCGAAEEQCVGVALQVYVHRNHGNGMETVNGVICMRHCRGAVHRSHAAENDFMSLTNYATPPVGAESCGLPVCSRSRGNG